MTRQVIVIKDLGHGDSGKGTMVDAYAGMTDAHTVVRDNGGAQALHYVMTNDGRVHGFAQFGSATFRPRVRTHLSRFMLVSPTHMLEEERQLHTLGVTDAFARLTIDREAPVITLYHRLANWLRELARGAHQHGSCGMGIAETMQDLLANHEDVLRVGDLQDAVSVARKMRWLRLRKREELASVIAALPDPTHPWAVKALKALSSDQALASFLENTKRLVRQVKIVDGDYLGRLLAETGTVIFEGAQGVLLDEWYGFHPHTTWSTTTFENADTLLAEQGYGDRVIKIGVLRAYATRHGAGPLVTYDPELMMALPEAHNHNSGWQGWFRVGWFDLVAARYALDVVGKIDGLAITNLDRVAHLPEMRLCDAYRYTPVNDDLETFHRYFGFSFGAEPGMRLSRIVVDRSRNLDRQAEVTRRVLTCQPEYRMVRQKAYLSSIVASLGVPIAATSRGQKAADKHFLMTDFLSPRESVR